METLTVFLLTVFLQSNPVMLGIDGEYTTKDDCEQAKIEAIKANPKFKSRLRCLQVVVEAPPKASSPKPSDNKPKKQTNHKEQDWAKEA